MKNNKGFTLVELIVVLAIVGIISAIAVPKFIGIKASAKEKAEQADFKILTDAIKLATINGDLKEDSGYDVYSLTEDSLQEYAKKVDLKTALVPKYIDKIPEVYDKYEGIRVPENLTYGQQQGYILAHALIRMIQDGRVKLNYVQFGSCYLEYEGKRIYSITDEALKNEITSYAGLSSFPQIDGYNYQIYGGLDQLAIIKIPHPDRSQTNLAAIKNGTWEFVPYGQGYN